MGGDLTWTDEGWTPRRMSAPRWVRIGVEEKRRFRINAYRVLLTRARAGLIIHVPLGDVEDETRNPDEFEAIAAALVNAGAAALPCVERKSPYLDTMGQIIRMTSIGERHPTTDRERDGSGS